MRLALEGDAAAILVASSVEEAVQIARTALQPTDVIVADAGLRSLTGKQRIEELSDLNPPVPVLYCSGYDREALESRGIQIPPSAAFLAKPFTIDQLRQAVRQLTPDGDL